MPGAPPGAMQPRAGGSNTLLIVGLLFGLLVIGGIVAALVLGKTTPNEKKDNNNSNANNGQQKSDIPEPTSPTTGIGDPFKRYEQHCANSACTKCKDGWGPEPEEDVDEDSVVAGYPPCSLRRAFVYKQSPLVDWAGVDADYSGFGAAQWGVCADMDAQPAPDNFTFNFSRKANYNIVDEEDAEKDPANRLADPWLSRAPFAFLMSSRNDDSDLTSIAKGGKKGHITCRKRGLAIPVRAPREQTCREPDKENFEPPECVECAAGYGPEPPAENACKQEYVRDYHYRLLPACFRDADRRRAACGSDGEFVEAVPQGSSIDSGSPLYQYQPYQSLYEKITKAHESFGSPAAMRAQGLNPCAPEQAGVICRQSAFVPPSDVETPEHTLLRESKPLEKRKVQRDREQRETLEQWQADKQALKPLLETRLQQRVLVDERTGAYGPGFSGKFVPLYREEFGKLPVLGDQASAYFDALSESAKQNLALEFLGPQGTLNSEQQRRVCAVRRDLADFRSAIERYLERTFNEWASWPPRAIPPVLEFSNGTEETVCV